jgi:hypothetical protein
MWEAGKRLISYLGHEVRKRILFQNDAETHRNAKKASDDLEHGFTNFGALRPIAKEAIALTAKYLRTAILDLAGLDQDRKRTILGKPYDTSRPFKECEVYLGEVIGEHNNLAVDRQTIQFCFGSRV